MNLMRVTATDYVNVEEDGQPEPVVKMVGRGENGERRVHHVYGTEPYLYVREGTNIPEGHENCVTRREDGYESFDGVPLEKWYTRIPEDVNKRGETSLVDVLDETWESDIPFYRRASIDYNLSGYVRVPDEKEVHIDEVETDVDIAAEDAIEPRVVYGDIETTTGGSIEEMLEEADQTITNITLYDSYEEVYDVYCLDPEAKVDGQSMKEYLTDYGWTEDHEAALHICPTEEALLESFLGYFEDRRPDLTTGWNWVEFDVKYLLRRIKRLHDDDNDLDLNRLSDAGGIKHGKASSDRHGHLARAITGVPAVDLMKLFFERIEYTEWRSKALDYVAQKLLGKEKISGVSVSKHYEEDRSKLAAYNVIDVLLCVEIDEVRDVLDTCMGLAEESQIQIYDTFSEMRLVDGYIMARADDDEILPPQEEKDVPENAGGLVLQPADGISEWVGVMDLKSLYPSSMITWNISPETVEWKEDLDWRDAASKYDLQVPWVPEASEVTYPVTEEGIDWDRLVTTLDQEGLLPKYLKLLFENREEAKAERDQYDSGTTEYETWDLKQYGLKVLMNSFYGVSSNDYWRLAKDGLGDAITSASRYALFKGKQVVEGIGYETIYGDTDSCFIDLRKEEYDEMSDKRAVDKAVMDGKGLVSQVNGRMEEAIRDSGLEGEHPYLDGTLPHDKGSHCLHYEFEKLYRRYVQFGTKKRYAGLIRWKEGKEMDKMDVTGFEVERSDVPELAAEAQEEVLYKVLDGSGFDGVSSYVSGLCDDIESEELPLPKIARPKSLAKSKSEYASKTQTLKACEASEEQLGHTWVKGDDPFLIFLDETPPMEPSVSVIALPWGEDLPGEYTIDAAEHIRICLKLPLDPILSEVGWEWTEVKTGTQAGDASESDWGGSNSSPTPTPNGGRRGGEGRDDGEDTAASGTGSGGALEEDW